LPDGRTWERAQDIGEISGSDGLVELGRVPDVDWDDCLTASVAHKLASISPAYTTLFAPDCRESGDPA
jgi:hypothetical protein